MIYSVIMLPQLKIIMIVTAKEKKFNIYIYFLVTDCFIFVKTEVFFPGESFFNFNSLSIIKLCPHILPLSELNIVGNYEITRSLFITIQIIPTVES